jgi:hypothetical protein
MSEDNVSPNPRFDKKSSLKKSSTFHPYLDKPDQSKSKKKPIEFIDPPTPVSDNHTLETAIEEKPEPKLQSRSSKREALRKKEESHLKEHLK